MVKFAILCNNSENLSDVIVCGALFVGVAGFIGAALFVGAYDEA